MVAAWQPGTTYAPGALVVPRSAALPAFTGLANANLMAATGWDLDTGLSIVSDGQGYGGGGRVYTTAVTGTSGGFAVNQTKIPVVPGQVLTLTAMVRHDTNDKRSSDGAPQIWWYNASNASVDATRGQGIPRLSEARWQQESVTATAPATAAYARVGVFLYRTGSDTVQAANFQLSYTPQVSPRAALYEATQANPGKSGSSEPKWPPVGQSVQDNEVTWEGVNLDRLVWQASPLLESGATEPAWPTFAGGAVHDGTIDWIAEVPIVTDPNVPDGYVATIGASKIFIGDNDIVRFCATNNAADWTAQYDAGYLPTGLQSASETECTGLGLYRGNLAVFMANTLQIWQIDPDPAQMSFLDQVPGIGTVYQRAICPMEGDLYFLSAMGVRSVSISAGTANLEAGDIGTPIDSLVRADLAAYRALLKAGTPPAWEPIGVNFPSAGQFWLCMGDHAWVYTSSPAAQLAAWSEYTFPWTVTDACVLDGDLYVRADDDCVYRLDKEAEINSDVAEDDTASSTSAYTCTVRWPYLDFGNGGGYVDTYGADVLFKETVVGTAGVTNLQLGYDENDLTELTDAVAISAVQARGQDGFVPVEISTPSVSPQVTYKGDGSWELTQVNLYVSRSPRAP